MIRILIILSVVIAILLGLLGITYKEMRSQRSESIRWENNYQKSQEDISRIQLTSKEFKNQISDLEDSLLKVNDIKPKQVEKIIYIESNYSNTDTIDVELEDAVDITTISKDPIVLEEEKTSRLNFTVYDKCSSISGYIKTKDAETKLKLTNISFNNDITYIAYWKRREWKLLGIKTRLFGKKQGELEVSSTCGETIVKEIDIIKKK